MISEKNLIWIDMEMTGLSPRDDRIIEIATVITNADLNVIAEGPVFAIHQSNELLKKMDAWNVEHHTRSGLLARVKASEFTEAVAEEQTLAFIKRYVPERKSPICGNSVHQDRHFLYRYMPKLEQYFHYRNFDVSSIKIAAALWAPDVVAKVEKNSAHLALQDIYESIEELRLYRKSFFSRHN